MNKYCKRCKKETEHITVNQPALGMELEGCSECITKACNAKIRIPKEDTAEDMFK